MTPSPHTIRIPTVVVPAYISCSHPPYTHLPQPSPLAVGVMTTVEFLSVYRSCHIELPVGLSCVVCGDSNITPSISPNRKICCVPKLSPLVAKKKLYPRLDSHREDKTFARDKGSAA